MQPGGGVPIVLRGAGVVLDCVLEDFGGMVDGNKALENGTGALANGNGVLVDGKEANGKLNSKMNGKMNGMMNGKSEDIMEDYRMGNANGSAREEEGRKTCGMRTLGMTMGARRKRWRQVLGLLLACMVVWLFGLYGRLGSAGGMLRT